MLSGGISGQRRAMMTSVEFDVLYRLHEVVVDVTSGIPGNLGEVPDTLCKSPPSQSIQSLFRIAAYQSNFLRRFGQ